MQITRYESNSQPLYVILNNKGEDASKPIGILLTFRNIKNG